MPQLIEQSLQRKYHLNPNIHIYSATSSDMKHNSEREHYVVNGSDLSLSCGVVSDKDSLGLEQPVVWRWSHQDDINVRVLSVGKMLVRRDGKGLKKSNFSIQRGSKYFRFLEHSTISQGQN